MNPRLESPTLLPGESRAPASVSVLLPHTVHDLRGRAVDELRYPATAVLVFAGVPGAGKSTALRRLFGSTAEAEWPPAGPQGSVVLDSQHSRNSWRHRLGRLPYPLWRPVVHIAHYSRIRNALRDNAGPVVVHDCATFGWARRMLARWAAARGRELHLILIDVPATIARAGQYSRGRRVNGFFFRLHCVRWQRLLRQVGTEPITDPAPASIVIADRDTVDGLSRVGFAA
ncbi:AAA family ATPase [Nocardia cyriacigeorgica]|uniref:AAA family ATPase n=1 Tax=Nocardia cyriacigeorgica TaxID=135487 RepID=UPI002457174F|nr:AAA family ATPase [Nocardia cyriacigeorgica]